LGVTFFMHALIMSVVKKYGSGLFSAAAAAAAVEEEEEEVWEGVAIRSAVILRKSSSKSGQMALVGWVM